MKVVILYNGIHPSPTPMSKRLGLYEKGLKYAGVEASLLTSVRKSNSSFFHYIDPFIIPFTVRRQHHRSLKNADVILVDGFNWFTYLWLGLWYRTGKRKLVYELNEKPGTVYTSRILEIKPIKYAGLVLNKISMCVFDGFIVISEPLRQFISERMNRDSKIVKLPIIIDVREPFNELSEEIPPHPYIIHTGALSQQKDGIIDVFKAFAKVNAQIGNTLHFYIAGSKDAPPGVKEEIDQIIEGTGLRNNIHYLGLIFGDKLKTLQKNCLFLVLPKPDNEQNRNNFPTKLGEYLAFSRPTITTRVGDMALFLKDGENAILVDHGNVDQISGAMLQLMTDKNLYKKIGDGGQQVAEHSFDYTILGQQLADFLYKLTS